MSTAAPAVETWIAPGPGMWERDAAHQERPFSTLWLEVATPAFGRGFEEAFRRFGLPFDRFEAVDVGGWFFGTITPAADEDFPARAAAAEAALGSRPWRAIADEWKDAVRGLLLQRNRVLQAIEPRDLDDGALAAHIVEALALLSDGAERHFLQAGAHWVGVGLFANEAAALTGWAPERVVQALVGGSPTSIATVAGLRKIATAVASDARASAILGGSGEPSAELSRLRDCSDAIAQVIDAYLDDHGWQVFTGFDFTHEAMIELPGLLLATIRSAGSGGDGESGKLDELRAAVPASERERFEGLLEDALILYGLRDDDSGITTQRPIGLVRRALLEAGRRLVTRGAVHDADDAFDATLAELSALFSGDGQVPGADELARRAARRRPPFAVPPRRLGEEDPPPEGELPPAMETIMGALFTAMALEDTVDEETSTPGLLQGAAVSTGVYEGTARLISGPGDFERLEAGDVLVTAITTPAYNVLLPLLGALVTDRGGMLSHPAIVAREFGIPAVVGTGNATTAIRDGMRIRVDGTAGTVKLLD